MANPFDFGNVAVCERCGVTMPADQARVIPRIIYTERASGDADTTRTNLVVCPRCLQAIAMNNQWENIRYWVLLVGVGVIGAILLLLCIL